MACQGDSALGGRGLHVGPGGKHPCEHARIGVKDWRPMPTNASIKSLRDRGSSYPTVLDENHRIRRQSRTSADDVRIDDASLLVLVFHLKLGVVDGLERAQDDTCFSWKPATPSGHKGGSHIQCGAQ